MIDLDEPSVAPNFNVQPFVVDSDLEMELNTASEETITVDALLVPEEVSQLSNQKRQIKLSWKAQALLLLMSFSTIEIF